MMCDGATEDEVLFDMYGLIQKFGFMMTAVEGSSTWTYTVGLAEQFHPELVVTALAPRKSFDVLRAVVDHINAGERFDECSPPLDLGGLIVRFGRVHVEQWHQGRFDRWLRYYGALGDHGWLQREAVQVLWPDERGNYPTDSSFCCNRPTCQPLLDVAPASNVNTDEKVER